MKGFAKKITAVVMSFSMLAAYAVSPSQVFAENDADVYTCDFTKLVKDNADTYYGEAGDIIQLDDFTTANLTYAGTYVSADGTVHLTGSNEGKGAYTNGSYIEFTAPADGTVSFTRTYVNYFIDGTYTGYSDSDTVELKAGQKFQVGERASDRSIISALTFTPKTEPPVYDEVEEYDRVAKVTTWDFDNAGPAREGYNKPVISGTAEYDQTNKNVRFLAADTNSGALTVDFDTPVKNNIKIEFDVNMAKLSGQYFTYSIKDAEGNELVYCNFDIYNAAGELLVGGNKIADASDFKNYVSNIDNDGMKANTTHFLIKLDFNALKAEIGIGGKTYSDLDLQEETTKDIDIVQIQSSRSKAAAQRIIYVDNLTISEFTSTEDPATPTITEGYTVGEYNGMNYRISKPSEQSEYPLVVYLHSSVRNGDDNYSQLYQAQYLFNQLKDKAILVAPQTEDRWNANTVAALIDSIENVDTDKVYLAGQGDGADAALEVASADQRPSYALKTAAVIAIAPTCMLGYAQMSNLKTINMAVYTFAEYGSSNVETIRANINQLQTFGLTDVMYTEYPFEQGNIAKSAAETTGIADWLLAQSLTVNADEKDAPRVVDLVLFAGQSNMAGRGDYADATECPPGHGFEYHSVTEPGVLTTVSEPFGKYENNTAVNDNGGNGLDRRSGDMVSSFMESYYQVSGVPIVGVQCSRGGQATDYFMGTAVMSEMISRYNEAEQYLKDSGYTIGKKFMVWCQGETDADRNRTDDSYKTNTLSIFNSLKTGTGLTDMFMIRIGHCKTSGAAAIDETNDPVYKRINLAQKALADANSDITAVASFYTDEYAALMRDQYHYYQPAYNSIGKLAGNNTAYTLYGKGTWTAYPEPDEKIEPSDNKVKSSYDADSKTLTLTAPDETVTSADVIIASYSDKTLTDATLQSVTFTNKTAVIKGITITDNDKVFVWDSVKGMKPLSDVFTLSE